MADDTRATGELLWSPAPDALETTRVGDWMRWVGKRRGIALTSYEDAWRWSVDDIEGFWASVWEYFDIAASTPYETVLDSRDMPGASWFTGARLNYAEHALRHLGEDRPAVISHSQTRAPVELTGAELRDQVARAAAGLRRLGVVPGDRVAGYLPNIAETIVAFLATATLGATWASCAPEFGTRSVIDRLSQIDPKVLITVDGYRYGSRDVDRTAEIAAIRAALPGLESVVCLPYLSGPVPDALPWEELLAEPAELSFEPVPFAHPLYVLFSSGTTGLPKPIVHGHGGILLEHHKMLALHHDLREEDRFFWFTTTGWMMWNYLVSGLLVGAGVVCFDGNPSHPEPMALWRLAADTRITMLGTSPAFLLACRKAGIEPPRETDLSALRQVASTGAPLTAEAFHWFRDVFGDETVLTSASGGTDMCTAFTAASPLLPVWAGEISCRALGAKVEAFDPEGNAVTGQLGELVIAAPMPSMPVGFWGDEDGSRYRAAYFEDFPGVWRHGDWIEITERGSCIITGRSDATLNRGGVRLGTAEFYSAVEALDGVGDSLVIHIEDAEDGVGELLLFVAPAEGREVDDELKQSIVRELRTALSPRHVPDEIVGVPAIPRTLSGKKLEVPVKKILLGMPADRAASRGALSDPDALAPFEDLARERGN